MSSKTQENEIALSIKYLADKANPKKDKLDLRGFADHLMTWANLVFATLVLGQVFSDKIDTRLAYAGFTIFVVVYAVGFFLYISSKGGDRK